MERSLKSGALVINDERLGNSWEMDIQSLYLSDSDIPFV